MSARQASPLMVALAVLLLLAPVHAAPDNPHTLPHLDLSLQGDCVDCPPNVYGLGDGSMRLDSLGSSPCRLYPRLCLLRILRRHSLAYGEESPQRRRPFTTGIRPRRPLLWMQPIRRISPISTPTIHSCFMREQTATGWDVQIVDTGPAPPDSINYETALALDREGAPHLVYALRGKLKYARLDPATGWQIQTIDQRRLVGNVYLAGAGCGRHAACSLLQR